MTLKRIKEQPRKLNVKLIRLLEITRKLGQELIVVEQENDEVRTELMEDGIAKRLKQINDEYEKKKQALAKQKATGRLKIKKPALGANLPLSSRLPLMMLTPLTSRSVKKDTERLYRELTDEYQSYTDKRLEIERKHNEDIAALEQARARATKDGDSKAAARIERSIAEAIKSKRPGADEP